MTAVTTRRMLKGGRRLRDGRDPLLVGRDPRDPRVLPRVLRDPERQRQPSLHAFDDAKHIISLEHHLGIFHEATIQRWALHFKPLIITANYMYGSLHFIVTIWVAVWLFRSYSDDYPRYRNTLAITTALALIGFTIFPLMPPRLLARATALHIGFVDTLRAVPDVLVVRLRPGGPDLEPVRGHAQRAHRVVDVVRARAGAADEDARRARSSPRRYPVITLVVIVITANHYVIDAVGGLVILSIGWVLANRFTRAGRGPAESTRRRQPISQAVPSRPARVTELRTSVRTTSCTA